MFHLGQEIVCVIGGRLADSAEALNVFPVKGETYRIRNIETSLYKLMTGQVGIVLEEIRNDINPATGNEWSYFSRRFRPVVKQKVETSISIFEKLLNPAPSTPVTTPAKKLEPVE